MSRKTTFTPRDKKDGSGKANWGNINDYDYIHGDEGFSISGPFEDRSIDVEAVDNNKLRVIQLTTFLLR